MIQLFSLIVYQRKHPAVAGRWYIGGGYCSAGFAGV
jgi:hypothetical protein